MWIARDEWQKIRTERDYAASKAATLSEQNKVLQVTLDWLRVRQTQVEHERAQLLFNYTGVKVNVPVIEHERPSVEGHPLNAVPNFEDMGDEEAARLGIGWAPDGTIRYPETPTTK